MSGFYEATWSDTSTATSGQMSGEKRSAPPATCARARTARSREARSGLRRFLTARAATASAKSHTRIADDDTMVMDEHRIPTQSAIRDYLRKLLGDVEVASGGGGSGVGGEGGAVGMGCVGEGGCGAGWEGGGSSGEAGGGVAGGA